MIMKVGFYQFRPLFGKPERNLYKIINALKDVDADLIVLPELALSGYYFKDKNEKEKFLCRHEYTCEIGTNKWFSGDGLTKTNGNSGYVPANQHGTLESITLERSPKTIAELEDPSLGAITRVPAKPIKG